MRNRVCLVFVLSLLQPLAAAAQSNVEVFGGASIWVPTLDVAYDASYTPSRVAGITDLFAAPDSRSAARQPLAIVTDTGGGIGFGANVFFADSVGVQVLFERASVDISGTNTTHEVDLTFDTIAFPSSVPIVSTINYRFDVPPTSGHLDEAVFSVNLVRSIAAEHRVAGTVSGGFSYYRAELAARELQTFAAWLGGHAVVFSEQYRLTYHTDPSNHAGLNIGGDISVAVGARLSLFADGRYFYGRASERPIRLGEPVSDNIILPSAIVAPGELESFLALPDLTIDPSYGRVLVGLKWRP